ncbi:hypothetical protein [Pseudoalteromonas sp. SR45-4]|uniref:hypothetical protein n=1 Tax=Pseudoalteromonas sp. SR45-4 TaxID=2760929 RepID=UPI0015FD2BDC|nr:hypothetical protein [Pseudoalteromonas sp. SR45-4]MBB1372627.1 hypothetical protein [Pseudoalteromonas sp. SR45-4]
MIIFALLFILLLSCCFMMGTSGCESLVYNKVYDENKPAPLTELGLVCDYVVLTNSDAERVHNLENLIVRTGKFEGKKWSEVPSNYLYQLIRDEGNYSQMAKMLLAARKTNYTFV